MCGNLQCCVITPALVTGTNEKVGRRGKGKIRLHSATFAHIAFSGAVGIDRAAVQPRPQQAKPTHTDRHTAARSLLNGIAMPPNQIKSKSQRLRRHKCAKHNKSA